MNPHYIKAITGILITLVLLVGFSDVVISRPRPLTPLPVRPSVKPAKQLSRPVNWQAPSMRRPYPTIAQHPRLKIKVALAKQRVYLMEDAQPLYTMLASTGRSGADTPTGQFVIEPERGLHFFNAQSQEGANYWVSFSGHGNFLFHSVPVDQQGHYVEKEAQQLGQLPNSHGCVRLTVADAKWLYENIRVNTPVEVA